MGNLCSVSIAVDNTVSRCQDFTASHSNYLCKLEDNLRSLRIAFQELKELRNDVKRKVEISETLQMIRFDRVNGWLSRVAEMEAEVDKLVSVSLPENQCLGGFFSRNCWSNYKLGQKVAKMVEEVNGLKSKGYFEEVAGPLPVSLVEERPSEPTRGLESMFSQVWNCLNDEQIGIIGLYGMGGVGKTTLLTQVNNGFQNSPGDFDFVIWVVVSKDMDLEKIQDNIGKRIGFSNDTWKNEGRDEKAIDIYRVLSKKRFVLFLDDLWERIDLTKVGIPHPDSINRSKIAFTTRSDEVCGKMGAFKIKIECLAWEKAWELFQDKVGKKIIESHPDIPELARCVAKECGGLPLALVTIGRAMACKRTPQEWRRAIDVLRKSASEFAGMEDDVLRLLKFSYDYLPNDTVRSCFLYCALFPEDFLIIKLVLIDFWIGEGFLDEYDGISGPRNEGYEIIGTLINACLLEDEGETVKLHDVIRDMALWIGCECGKSKDKFLVQTGARLRTPPEAGKWKGAERISLMDNCLERLTETPICSSLLTLFLSNNLMRKIGNDFFQYSPVLRVLDLSNNADLSQLPLGISKLTSLQYLNLSNTGISQLPIGLRMLKKMKYLNLSQTTKLHTIPPQVISSFSELQVCELLWCGSVSPAIENNVLFDGCASLLAELECLEHLTDLAITIRSSHAFEIFLRSEKLQSCIRDLSLEFSTDEDILNLSSSKSLKHVQSLIIGKFGSVEVVTIDWEWVRREMEAITTIHNSVIITQSYFHNLYYVCIEYCSRLTDLTWIIFAQNIRKIVLRRCNKIQELLSTRKLGEAPEVTANLNLLAKLEYLSLLRLPQLKSIYWNTLPFNSLKQIRVVDCPQLKRLPLKSDSTREHKIIISGEEDWWNQIEWENDATRNAFLPCFKSLN